MKTDQKGASILSYGLLAMTVTHTLTHVFQQIHLALFPTIRDEFNLSLQQLGIIAAIPPLCQALLSIPTGLLSDRFGSKKMILVSLFVAAVGSFLASRTLNPLMLTAAISLVYINTTIYHPASYSFTTRLFRPQDRSKALGIHGAGGTLGMAIGPISAGILMGIFAFGWRQVYFFWIIPILLGVVAVLLIRFEPKVDAGEQASTLDETRTGSGSMFTLSFILFLVFLAVRNMGGRIVSPFLTIYLVDEKGLSETFAELILGAASLVGLVAAPIGGFLAYRFGEKPWLLVALSMAYVFLGLAVFLPGVASFILLYISYSFCNFLGMAANSAIMASLSTSRKRGLGYALFFLPGSIVGAVGPVVAAQIAGSFGLHSIFIAALAVFSMGLVVLKFGVKV